MSLNESKKSRPSAALLIGGLLVVCVGLLMGLRDSSKDSQEAPIDMKHPPSSSPPLPAIVRQIVPHLRSNPESAEAIVARKLTRFSQKQRRIFEAMAAKLA